MFVAHKSLSLIMICAAASLVTACNGAPANEDEASTGSDAFTATPTLAGWPLIPSEGQTDVWLVDGEVSLRFERVERQGIDDQGKSRPECQAVVASKAKLFVYNGLGPSPTASVSISVEDTVRSATSQGARKNPAFDNLTFKPGFRPGTGESAMIANVPEFPIAARCSGTPFEMTQSIKVKKTSVNGTAANLAGTTSLASTLSMGQFFSPASQCERTELSSTPGVTVERCVGAPRDPREQGYSQLRVTLVGSDPGTLRDLEQRKHSLWLSLNGVANTYPMTCYSRNNYPVFNWACTLTVSTTQQSGLRVQDGPVVDQNTFTWARRDRGYIVNAWDLEFAAVSETGRWVKAGNQNFRARFGERDFR